MNATEEWRPVVGYEGAYEVSNHGRVRSLDRWTEQGFRKGRLLSLCTAVRGGYHVVNIRPGPTRKVHQLVLEAFVGPRPEGCEVLHGPGGPQDNRVENLRWGTRSENVRDLIEWGGTHPQASKTHCPREALKPIRDLEVPGFLEALAEILENLVMDTPKDQELTDRYVTMLRNAAANLRPLIYSSDELGEVE